MGASLGVTLGLVGFVRAWLTPIDIAKNPHLDMFELAKVVAIGVAVVVLAGNLVGAAAVGSQAAGLRSGADVEPLCGQPGGRDRDRDLFRHRPGDHSVTRRQVAAVFARKNSATDDLLFSPRATASTSSA